MGKDKTGVQKPKICIFFNNRKSKENTASFNSDNPSGNQYVHAFEKRANIEPSLTNMK